MLMASRIFPYAVAVLELGAGLVYAYYGDVRLTILWLGYAVAAFALAGLK